MASGDQRLLSWLGSGDSLQPEAPPERRRVAGQAPALSPQQPPRQRAGCERARPITLRMIAIEAGSISGRGQGSRLQASDGSQACSARSPGAAPPLTMLARRGLHSGRQGYRLPGCGAWQYGVWYSGYILSISRCEPHLRSAFRATYLRRMSHMRSRSRCGAAPAPP